MRCDFAPGPACTAADKERTSQWSFAPAGNFWRFPGPPRCPTKCCGRCIARRRHLCRPAGGALTDSLLRDLAPAVRHQGRAYIYIANGHGAWEAALTNVLSRGDKMLVLESGRFAIGWGDAAAAPRRRGRGAEGRLAPRGAAGGSRGAAAARTGITASRRCWSRRSIPPPASSTTSRRSARRSRRPAIRRCSWSMRWPRSAACRSRWMPGASMSRCRDRRKA